MLQNRQSIKCTKYNIIKKISNLYTNALKKTQGKQTDPVFQPLAENVSSHKHK